MADGDFFPKPISKDESNNAVANPIFVQLSDGSAAVGVTSGSLDVNVSNASITVTATDLDIRNLSAAQDNVAISDGTDTLAVNADGSLNITDNGGSITVDGTVAITDGGGSITVDAVDLDIRDLTHATDSVKVGDGTDFLAVNADGSINVNVISSVLADEYHNHNIGANTANGDTTHTVTASGGTMLVTSIIVSSSGGVKYVAANNAVAVATGFLGRDGNTDQLFFDPAVEVADGNSFTIVRTNRQGVANDVYSTVMGRQL